MKNRQIVVPADKRQSAVPQQNLLRFKLGHQAQPLYAQGFKDLTARYFQGNLTTGETLFHFRDGKPINTKPDIRFVGGKTWVGVLSDKGNTELLVNHVADFSRILSKHSGRPVPMTLEELDFDAQLATVPSIYYFRDVAVRRSKGWKGTLEDLFINRLTRALRSYRDTRNLDLPGSHESAKADAQAIVDRLQIQVHEIASVGMRLTVAAGDTYEYMHLLNGKFSMYCDLSGIWQIGNLQSRGHGRIVKQYGVN